MVKKFFLFLFVILIVVIGVSADYKETGNNDGYFRQDAGAWTSLTYDSEEYTIYTKPVGTTFMHPLVADFDADGHNEIMVMGGNVIKLYENTTLDPLDGYSTGCTNYSNIIAYDIDGDTKQEIIYACQNIAHLYILDYDGSTINLQTDLNIADLDYYRTGNGEGEMVIKCRAVDECLLMFTKFGVAQKTGSVACPRIYGMGFSSTTNGTETLLAQADNCNEFTLFCMPYIRAMGMGNIDLVGGLDFSMSFFEMVSGGDDEMIRVVYANLTGGLDVDVIAEGSMTMPAINLDNNGARCDTQRYGRYVSAPLTYNFDLNTGLETVVGYNEDTDEFVMTMFAADGSAIDTYPEIFQADGLIISNPIRANIFTDTSAVDFCVMGYDDTSEELDLLCASASTGETPQTREFKGASPGYNLSKHYLSYETMVHAAQQKSDTTDGTNLDEIVMSFGTYSVDWNSVYETQLGANILYLDLEFLNLIGSGSLHSIDYQGNGYADLIALTDTNLFYIDDGLENEPAILTYLYSDPPPGTVWKQNTTVEMRMQVTDPDGDDVRAIAELYYGDNNYMNSSWSSYLPSGTIFSFTFTANETISNGIMRFIGTDTVNNATWAIDSRSFSVALQGLEYGDSQWEYYPGAAEENVTTEVDIRSNNTITETVVAMAENTGLGTTLTWILLMFVVGLMIYFWGSKSNDFTSPLITMGILEGLMLIMGIILGFISFAVVLVVIVICGLIFGVWLSRKFTGSSSGGG